MPASLAASACGFIDEGRDGDAESRVVLVVRAVAVFSLLLRSSVGEAARRAARECCVTSILALFSNCCVCEWRGMRESGLSYGAS